MPIVTNSHLINQSQYPPVFDGSKTMRPKPKRLPIAPPPISSESKQSSPLPVNDLEFSPPPISCKTLKDVLAGSCDVDVMDSMHVSTFEKLMRSTNYDLLAIEPETLPKQSDLCKKFLSVDMERAQSEKIGRRHFDKSCQADQIFCSLQVLCNYWNRLAARMHATLTGELMRRKLRPRYSHC